jgi:ribosomal protein L20A (L18A)
MKKFKVFGQATVWVTKEVEAENEQEAMMKINSMAGDLVADVRSIEIQNVDGENHKLEVDNFHIKWEEAEEK